MRLVSAGSSWRFRLVLRVQGPLWRRPWGGCCAFSHTRPPPASSVRRRRLVGGCSAQTGRTDLPVWRRGGAEVRILRQSSTFQRIVPPPLSRRPQHGGGWWIGSHSSVCFCSLLQGAPGSLQPPCVPAVSGLVLEISHPDRIPLSVRRRLLVCVRPLSWAVLAAARRAIGAAWAAETVARRIYHPHRAGRSQPLGAVDRGSLRPLCVQRLLHGAINAAPYVPALRLLGTSYHHPLSGRPAA